MIGGSRNDRIVRGRLRFVTEQVNPLEPEMRALSDERLLARTAELRERLAGGEDRERIKPEAFAVVREASRRARDHRQFDVQLVAGMVLDEGFVAEEATGEGKTIACYPAMYMAALEGMHTHVVTTNDFLVRRDAEFAQPVFEMLGLTVGYITNDMAAYGPDSRVRRDAYACDITYGTNSEFGFDYLRDNMKLSVAEQVQRSLDFAIVDEVDSILIDEARTPLIISGMAHGDPARYAKADAVTAEVVNRNRPWDRANRRVEALKRDIRALEGELSKARGDERRKTDEKLRKARADLAQAEEALDNEVQLFEVELDRKSAHLTHEGTAVAQDIAGVGSFYVGANMEWPHLMEQALRARLVYERDKDYVVQNGEVIIVDEFTGRLMVGRQWSDGLHQAVEAKEKVTIKQETQTNATITIQNYFKLYKKLAGMTGTAMTEAEEFRKIYRLDAASVPTHRPVNRIDHEDRIYAEEKAKYDAIVEEIHEVTSTGRPVLVGTTSIEKSEIISNMLTRRHGIEHLLLNGRKENADREGEIVKLAGGQHPRKKGSNEMVGNVTIATNMAGRGTDIKLAPPTVWHHCRVPSPEKLAELGLEVDPLYPPGVNKCCIYCDQYDPATDCAGCFKPKLDADFPLRGRTDCRKEVPCGLHIVGTERHEARRIDNQLRGRSGRQGDPGSSRFFLSLRDDLMTTFAGEWTVKVLGWLGLQGEVAIEDRRVTRGIERAQRKVEERNFEIRKNLLEYDEVMDHQRHHFYGERQNILEGRNLEGIVMEMVADSIDEAVGSYLGGDYTRKCIAEWARQNLQIQIDEAQVHAAGPDDLPSVVDDLRNRAKEEAASVIGMTLGEYMDEEIDPKEWDLRGLSSWAMSRFSVSLSQNQLRGMTPADVESQLYQAACERIDSLDMSPLGRLLEPGFAVASLGEWVFAKSGVQVDPSRFPEGPRETYRFLMEHLSAAYARREVEYPVEYAISVTIGRADTENVYALTNLAEWANRKYHAGIKPEDLRGQKVEQIHDRLVELSRQWHDGDRLDNEVRDAIAGDGDVAGAIRFARERFDTELTEADFDGDPAGKLVETGRRFLRREMTELERYVLLQIYDMSWMDHLLGMDHLKSGIGLRGFAEQDPRVAYKREGARLFQEMLAGVREKVTDMIFKVRLTADTRMASVYNVTSMVHEQLSAYDQVSRDMDAAAHAGEAARVKQIVRGVPKVGRNDPCPCGSGKKYKKCCGKGP
jgi:preprotein translocase subunit SecA